MLSLAVKDEKWCPIDSNDNLLQKQFFGLEENKYRWGLTL